MIDREFKTVSHPISALFLAACLLSGCMTGGDGVNRGASSEPQRIFQGTYRIEGGNIINEDRARPYSYCSGAEIVTAWDSLASDTIAFELAGNSLLLLNPDSDTMESGAVTQAIIAATRVGRGTSLIGLWQYTDHSYRILSGTLSAEERTRIEERRAMANARLEVATYQVQFSGGVITTIRDTKTAEVFVSKWKGDPLEDPALSDSARYDISVKILGKYEVELQGRLTGETVHLFLENDDSRTFQSSDPAHPFHRYDSTPKSCPNEHEPLWFRQFLDANYKTGSVVEKRGIPDVVSHPSLWNAWFSLNSRYQ